MRLGLDDRNALMLLMHVFSVPPNEKGTQFGALSLKRLENCEEAGVMSHVSSTLFIYVDPSIHPSNPTQPNPTQPICKLYMKLIISSS